MKGGIRVVYGISLAFVMTLSDGCQRSEREEARIPPHYSPELKKRHEADLIRYLTYCIGRRVDVAGSYYKRSRVYFDQGDPGKALEDIDQAIRYKDNVGDYYLQRGLVNRELNQLEEALRDAQRAEALQQKSPELYVLMADVLQEQKNYSEAENYIRSIQKMMPYDGTVYYVNAMLESKRGDTLAGIENLEKAIALNPKLLRAYKQAAVLYERQGAVEDADRVSDQALSFFPDNSDLLMDKALRYDRRLVLDSALIYYQKVAALLPDQLEAQIKIANVNIRLRNYNAALAQYEKIQQIDPDYPEIRSLIGFCHEKMWHFTTAKELYRKELELSPGSPQARSGLWRIMQQENQKYEEEQQGEVEKVERTLDNSRLEIVPIQPRSLPK